MIIQFVDINGIVDHHCLNFLFLKLQNMLKINIREW